MRKKMSCLILYLLLWIPLGSTAQSGEKITVGAKHFNEGYLLGEMIALILEDAGFKVDKRFNLGGTAVSFEGLRVGAIDVYPEYTGTISAEILKIKDTLSLDQQRERVKKNFGLEISDPFGFNNTYALLIKKDKANELNISKISDLRNHTALRLGLSHEFLKRQDGWGALSVFYDLPQSPTALEHGIAYQAILEDNIDILDAYSTDGEIDRYDLLLLKDDRDFFPDYQAVSFYRSSLPTKAKDALSKLTSSISADEMQELNSLALFEKKSHAEIAHDFLVKKKIIEEVAFIRLDKWVEILDKTWVHLKLTFLSLLAAMLLALPLGIFLYRYPGFSNSVLYVAGIMQTIPSIALLALMIPLFGIGMLPALIALFLYALLPILRNTVLGLFTVDPQLKKVASAIGLTDWQRLRQVELPLAMPSILAGVRTAAVITVGTATLAAFIGAGGLGEFIVTGLALNNTSLILKGAIPSALLAIVIELLFEGIERLAIPRHLRQKI
ncbi:MAG TPA: glycine betaine ABC transporter substrate-binding protein [Cyclobacteriaceae bacterium]|nr:glycine betaine ABC transporter substrate-binding protein [Cyclobacteriaceae bacterium]